MSLKKNLNNKNAFGDSAHKEQTKSTTNFTRRNAATENVNIESDKTVFSSRESLFNTAFSLPPNTTNKTPVSSTKKKPPSTILNSCYTPSSLYRSTPSKIGPIIVTPKTPKSSIKKSNQFSENKTPECFSKVLIETPLSGRKSKKSLTVDDQKINKDGEISNLTVAVRIRPLNSKECLNSNVTNIVHVDDNEVTILAGTSADSSAGVSHSFLYDNAFCSANVDDSNYADQEKVFLGTGYPLIEKAFQGYNACLFAYGQTGSGKSYSMMGIETDDGNRISKNSEAGIIPRFCHELFKRITALKKKIHAEIEVSYFEIYNEKIHDLLSVSAVHQISELNGGNQCNRNALKVREHPVWGPYVVDLSTHPVDSYESIKNWLAVGNSQRATAATGMNDKSSRSHSIFNIILNLSELENSNGKNHLKKIKQTKRSKISLVDLAGSERINYSGLITSEERIREGVSINKSLLTLGKVIAALADSKKGSFVPYRESVLTWLLRESLGGNSRTVMLATISPANIYIDETLATLRYACKARTIVNRVKVNEDQHDKIIRELRAEVERLQALRQDYERQKRHSANDNLPVRKIIIETSVDETEVDALRQQLAETEKELVKAQKSWTDRLKEDELMRKSEMRMIKRKGLALEFSVEQKQPCLVNLTADPILSGTLFYILPLGTVRIGRARPSAFQQPDIILDGPLVAFHHCSIENSNNKLSIIPENDETYLNGELVCKPKELYHGDRLVIGGSHYFRISNPFCTSKNKNMVVDYQLAHQEILHKQEMQLRRELDEEKKNALDQIEMERAAYEKNYKERLDILELEKFKYECSKELLETEKQVFKETCNQEMNTSYHHTPYKSTLLDDIKKMMQHPTEENLHKTQLKVKEATQRCKDVGLILEFKQSQVLDEFGIFRAVVSIIDRENQRKAEWPTARLDVWLDFVRETDVNRDNIFKVFELDWKPLNENLDETLNNSSNSSRISLNLSAIKDAILKEPNNSFQKIRNIIMSSPPQSNCSSSSGGGSYKKENFNKIAIINNSNQTRKLLTQKTLTYDDEDAVTTPSENFDSQKTPKSISKNFNSSVRTYLKDMHRSTLKFKKVFTRFESNENCNSSQNPNINYCKKSIEQIERIIFEMNSVFNGQELNASPIKTPKSVRFLLE